MEMTLLLSWRLIAALLLGAIVGLEWQWHLPIHSADDLKYSLTFIHQFRLQWPGMGDSSFVSAGETHLLDDFLFVLEGKRRRAQLAG
jgi:hypothetical protein